MIAEATTVGEVGSGRAAVAVGGSCQQRKSGGSVERYHPHPVRLHRQDGIGALAQRQARQEQAQQDAL